MCATDPNEPCDRQSGAQCWCPKNVSSTVKPNTDNHSMPKTEIMVNALVSFIRPGTAAFFFFFFFSICVQ